MRVFTFVEWPFWINTQKTVRVVVTAPQWEIVEIRKRLLKTPTVVCVPSLLIPRVHLLKKKEKAKAAS